MTYDLEPVFRELGLAQYLDSFVDQGFDTWDTILDIQESDLDALGVKLGHRRKLQRRIANARGIAPSVSLASLKQNPTHDGSTSHSPRREGTKSDSNNESVPSTNGTNSTNGTTGANGVTKRKYRRHPKPDENAPERPPSAYVLFSNKMREDLKSQNLTFTEIAKLVGENWQSLAPNEREVHESQANAAKEKYHRHLTQYKKTPEYKKYSQYLVDFKEKQARQNQVPEVIKRPKLEPARLRHGSTSSSATPAGTISSGSGSSSSEKLPGTDTSSNRKRRVDSTVSIAESALSNRNSSDDTATSPRSIHFEGSPRDPAYPHTRRPPSWVERDGSGDTGPTHLPSLSDVLDGGVRTNLSPEYGSNTVNRWEPRRPNPSSHAPVPPMLHESSSGSSGSSGVAVPGRPVNDSALPIHALLSNRVPGKPPQRPMPMDPMKPDGPNGVAHPDQGGTVSGYGFQTGSSVFQQMNAEQSADGDVVMTSDGTHGVNGNGHRQPLPPHKTKADYNGMDALLQAGEIVGRRVPE